MHRVRNVLLPIICALMMLAACASTGEPATSAAPQATAAVTEQSGALETQEPAAADEVVADEVASASDADEPTMNDAFISPIGEALGFDPDDRAAANNAYIRAAEDGVRQCMAAAGFDYVPENTGFAPSFERQLELQATLSMGQFTEQYGYGIATLFELNFQGEGVMAFVEQLLGPPPPVERSPAEQEAYDRALSGRTIQGLTAEEAQSQAFEDLGLGEPGSCRRVAYDEAENPAGELFEGLQSLLGDELRALEDRVASDPRIVEGLRSWQRCIGEAGYAFERPQEIRDFIEGSANDIGDRFTQSPEALVLFAKAISQNLAGMDSSARFNFLESIGAFQGFAMVPDLQVELDALIAYELEVAQTSLGCSNIELQFQVQAEVEQEFVQAHADQLALLVDGDA